jgi:hypothetical protein
MVYHKLPDKIDNPGPLLAAMRTCREAMLAESNRVKPMGTFYHGLHMVVAAIDALASLLNVRRADYFWNNRGWPLTSDGEGKQDGKAAEIADKPNDSKQP